MDIDFTYIIDPYQRNPFLGRLQMDGPTVIWNSFRRMNPYWIISFSSPKKKKKKEKKKKM
jgi:hypothetical protein